MNVFTYQQGVTVVALMLALSFTYHCNITCIAVDARQIIYCETNVCFLGAAVAFVHLCNKACQMQMLQTVTHTETPAFFTKHIDLVSLCESSPRSPGKSTLVTQGDEMNTRRQAEGGFKAN